MKFNKLTLAHLTWIDETVPYSESFGDVYFNTDGGVAEIEHTFIVPNKLTERFECVHAQAETAAFRVAETGFGSGLNFIAITALWLAKTEPEAPDLNKTKGVQQLHFISFEKFPMSVADLQKAHLNCLQFAEIGQSLRDNYPLCLPGWHDIWLFDNRVRLTLWFGDALQGLAECDGTDTSKVDAWLLDGFSPNKNPDMWQNGLFQQMARLSHTQTTFSTFTSASKVRCGLQSAGFEVHKASGFGKKREMCFGTLRQPRPHSLKAPWFSRPAPLKTGSAMVVGAGLAGASMAFRLAQSGWKVTVLEQEEAVATAASGNLAGTVHPLITADWNLRSQWYLQGFEATWRWLRPWLAAKEIQGDLQGMIQLLVTQTSLERVKESIRRVGLPSELAIWLTQEAASNKVGGTVRSPGLFFPQGGWLNPPSIVARCLQHDNITVLTNQSVLNIEKIAHSTAEVVPKGWSVQTPQATHQADIVVVATGSLSAELNNRLGLPIRPVKGQVTHLDGSQQRFTLKYPVTHAGYSSPCGQGQAVTGATFEAPDLDETLSEEGHLTNLETAKQALPNWVSVERKSLVEQPGRIAFRPTTPDHLPIFGAVPDADWMKAAYFSQSHTQAVYRYKNQQYQTGLYVSNGHGPRGLMSVFLAADSILADIQGGGLVQPLSLYHASHPARFSIRQWRSGKRPV